MRRSEDRILTTHVGSLPRDPELSDLLIRDEAGEAVDDAELARLGEQAVRHVVRAAGRRPASTSSTTASSRGSASRPTSPQRMKGFGGESKRPRSRDYDGLPELRRRSWRAHRAAAQQGVATRRRPCRGGLRRISAGRGGVPRCSRRRSSGQRGAAGRDLHDRGVARHHRHHHAQRPLRHARGLCLRARPRDAQGVRADRRATSSCRSTRPTSRMERTVLFQDKTDRRVRRRSPRCMSRRSTRRWPASRATAFGCTAAGATTRARTPHDIPLRDDPAGALPGAGRRAVASSSPTRATSTNTPRSRTPSCRPDFMLLPGVIDTTTNFVEHPEVVADRICEAVDAVGDRSA